MESLEASSEMQVASQSQNRPRRPRWWTVLVVLATSLLAYLAIAPTLIWTFFEVDAGLSKAERQERLQEIVQSRSGFLVMMSVQLVLLGVPVAAALLSPVDFKQRMSYRRGHWPIWAWLAAAGMMPVLSSIVAAIVNQVIEPSDHLRDMTDNFRDLGAGPFGLLLALLVGLVPAVCEEALFRGYAQTRLVRSFPPVIGVVITSILFAAFHMDPVHAIGVFPLGLVFGFIALRSGSVYPAMLAHFVNNFFQVGMLLAVTQIFGSPEAIQDRLEQASTTPDWAMVVFGFFFLTVMAFSLACVVPTFYALILLGPPKVPRHTEAKIPAE